MIEQIITSTDFGKLNVVCANAGIAKVGSLLDSTASDRKAIFDVNTHGVFNTAIAAARQIIKQGSGGRIISTASIAALRPFPMVRSPNIFMPLYLSLLFSDPDRAETMIS
jgi:NADP-dependent 3-hydroxy acid dehydrogenase YdfG